MLMTNKIGESYDNDDISTGTGYMCGNRGLPMSTIGISRNGCPGESFDGVQAKEFPDTFFRQA